MNKLDKDYLDLVNDILTNGSLKNTRNGDTMAIFGAEIKHDMRSGFPLLTTKKMFLRGIAVELEWFLKGGTNIKYMVDKGVNIWVGDSHKRYTDITSANNSDYNEWMKDNLDGTLSMYTEKEFIEKIKTDISFSEKWGSIGPGYGHQWRNYGAQYLLTHSQHSFLSHKNGIDQLANVINTLKANPDDRRMIVNAWNPEELKDCLLPPCHYSFQFYSEELSSNERWLLYLEKTKTWEVVTDNLKMDEDFDYIGIPKRSLSLKWNQRSCDIPLGIPYNIASYGLLLEIVAKQVNMQPKMLIGSLGDAHVYLNQIEQISHQTTLIPYELPTITLPDDVTIDNFLFENMILNNYESHPPIKITLSN